MGCFKRLKNFSNSRFLLFYDNWHYLKTLQIDYVTLKEITNGSGDFKEINACCQQFKYIIFELNKINILK